jgi:hypothetical protein
MATKPGPLRVEHQIRRLVACEGNKSYPHQPITYPYDCDHPYRCPLCEALDRVDELEQQLRRAEDSHGSL